MAVDYTDEFVRVEDHGDYARTIDWNDTAEFIGTYKGDVTRQVKGEDRVFQTFVDNDGNPVEAWGTAILNARLAKVSPGSRVKIVYLGKNAKTKRGVLAHNFDVFVARGSAPRAS